MNAFAAWACAVCGAGPQEASGALLAMTLMLSVLPLALIGGVTVWVVRGARRASREDES